jgi:amino acid adenylation domain-containing protein
VSIDQYLKELKAQGVDIFLHENGKDLGFRAKPGVMNDQIKTKISGLKPDIVEFLKNQEKLQHIVRSHKKEKFPLSAAQKRLWLQEQFHGVLNNLAGALRLKGTLDIAALKQSFMGIVQRHEVFHTRFNHDSDWTPYQDIEKDEGFDLGVEDLSQEDDPFKSAHDRVSQLASEKFDLQASMHLRANLFKIGHDDHVLFVNMPHIVADGVSLQIFDQELGQGYQGAKILAPPVRYVDYAEWESIQPPNMAAMEYWREQLDEAPVVTLKTDQPESTHRLYESSDCTLKLLNAEDAEQLKRFGAQRGATPFMTLLAAFALTLWRTSGEADLTVATAINNRPKHELQGLIGFFLNIIALRIHTDQSTRFGDLVQSVRQVCLEAYQHQTLAFEQLVEDLQPERVESRNPLARIAFAVGDTPWMPGHTLVLPGIDISPVDIERGMLDFDMHLWVADLKDGLNARLEFRRDLFSRSTAETFLERFKIILRQLVAKLDRPLRECDGLTQEERQLSLHSLSGQPASSAAYRHVNEAFKQSVKKYSTNTALSYGTANLDFAQLDQLSDRLACALIDSGIKTGDIVAIYLPTGIAMTVAIVAILKSGAAYLPLEVGAPIERLRFMLQDSEAKLLLTQESSTLDIDPSLAILYLNNTGSISGDFKEPESWPNVSAESLAYVMYTSGSTGTPKGVRIPHQAICRLVLNTNYVQIQETDRIGQVSNSAFDAFTFEIWGALLNGASVIGIDRDVTLDATALADALVQKKVTILFVTTALFNVLVRTSPESLSGLRYVLFGGEQSDIGLVREYLTQAQPDHLLHVYGPTENTTFSTFYPITSISDHASLLPIGQAIHGTSLFVLSQDQALSIPGVIGELYLGGEGLSDGYLKRPDLNAERFINHPFLSGKRLYRTGDKVKFNENGDLEFIGRIDNQIKLRGFRIELGEIETKLLQIPGVSAALTLFNRKESQSKIVAYVATTQLPNEIRENLEKSLPHYMIPAIIVCLPSLPINRNGKIDRSKLPDFESSGLHPIISPRDKVEEKLVEIWREVIECKEVSVDDHFFDIGGHSLLATRVVARVSSYFGIAVELRSLFENPSVEKYALWLKKKINHQPSSHVESMTLADRNSPLVLSSAQERLWFLDQMNPDSPAYNISYALRFKGLLNIHVLNNALNGLLERHESLRTRFINAQGQPVQEIIDDLKLELLEIDLTFIEEKNRSHELETHRLAQALQTFKTTEAPLIRATLYKISDQDWVLGICLHHIIADGWSLGVLRRDLGKLYDAYLLSIPADLPLLPIQYADYASWDRAKRIDTEGQLAYWKSQLSDLSPLRLPCDFPRPATPSFKGAAQRFTIDASTADTLRDLSKQEGATLYMTLLAAFSILLQRYSRQDDFAVGSPIAHRNHLDTENLIGFFVNTIVMRCHMNSDASFIEHLQQIREMTLAGYAHQDLPFEKLVQELDPERDPTANPLIQVIFALQNAPASQQQLHDVVIEPLDYLVATTRFDLEMHLWENIPNQHQSASLNGILVFDTALFHPETMAIFCRCFETLLKSVCKNPRQSISSLTILSSQDQLRLREHVKPDSPYPRDQSIVEIFHEQVSAYPDKAALLLESQQMSYRELDRYSTQFARALLNEGLKQESAVILKMESSFEFFISMIGVLKAGGCYVPVDPQEPPSRFASMVESLGTSFIIDQARYGQLMNVHSSNSTLEYPQKSTPQTLAYILFTSGSTGQPKGVRIPHRAVVRLVKNTNFHPFGDDEVWLQAASLAFDASTLEIWGALLNGASLAILPPGKGSFANIGATVQQHGVTSLWLTAGLFNALVDSEIDTLRKVKYLIAGGDVLSVKHVQKALRHLPDLTIVNGYGPTENTTFTCCHVMNKAVVTGQGIPIGKPVSHTEVVIVDEHLEFVPDGMPGELLAGGDGLARDYLNAPAFTQDRFILFPKSSDSKTRFYRTGDLVRRNMNGEIEFIERIDTQIKIRGFRVETGEIEQVLRTHPEVQDVSVLVQGEGERKQLVAYVVPTTPGRDHSIAQLGEQQIEDWESLFDGSLYQNLDVGFDPTFNIAGWKSSYTDQEIPTVEMKDWLDDFIDTVNQHQYQHVLEIGCGTGMILFRLAPFCKSYIATDFSKQALAHIHRHLPNNHQVQLLQREALDFQGFTAHQFDTIIINSVIQYFPDIDYLRQVIAGCLPLIRDGGRLIMGDIRSLPLLRAFHAGTTFAHADSHTRLREARAQLNRAMLEEDELAVSPDFFTSLNLERLGRISFRMQKPDHDNELSKFRYTTIIDVGTSNETTEYESFKSTSPDEVKKMIEANRPTRFTLHAVPNSRVSFEVALAEELNSKRHADIHVLELKSYVETRQEHGVDPKVWWELGESLGYFVEAGWSDSQSNGAYDVCFQLKTSSDPFFVGVPGRSTDGPFGNHPLRGKLARNLGPKLRKHCQENIPEYMLPSHFIMLSDLPLTTNGKIDKRALCPPERLTPRSQQNITFAENDVEKAIATIWGEFLGLSDPSVTDNFFDLGGHSMMMIQVCNRLRERLNQDVPVLMMFQFPTIRSLAQALGSAATKDSSTTQQSDAATQRARKQREHNRLRAAHSAKRK